MPTHPSQARRSLSPHHRALARALLSIAARWTRRGQLRQLSARSPERLLRDIGLTPADIETALVTNAEETLQVRAALQARNW